MPLLASQMWPWQSAIPNKCSNLGMLLMYIGLEVNNITIQSDYRYHWYCHSDSQQSHTHKHFSLVPWQCCGQISPLVQISYHSLTQLTALGCNKNHSSWFCHGIPEAFTLIIDLSQFLPGVTVFRCIFCSEVGCLINKWFIESNFLLKNEAMGSSIPMTISNPHRSDIGQEKSQWRNG